MFDKIIMFSSDVRNIIISYTESDDLITLFLKLNIEMSSIKFEFKNKIKYDDVYRILKYIPNIVIKKIIIVEKCVINEKYIRCRCSCKMNMLHKIKDIFSITKLVSLDLYCKCSWKNRPIDMKDISINLHSLCLNNLNIKNIDMLSHFKNLTAIYFNNCNIESGFYVKQLRNLDIRCCHISEELLRFLICAHTEIRNLKMYLNLMANVKIIFKKSKIKKLELGHIDLEGIEHLRLCELRLAICYVNNYYVNFVNLKSSERRGIKILGNKRDSVCNLVFD